MAPGQQGEWWREGKHLAEEPAVEGRGQVERVGLHEAEAADAGLSLDAVVVVRAGRHCDDEPRVNSQAMGGPLMGREEWTGVRCDCKASSSGSAELRAS